MAPFQSEELIGTAACVLLLATGLLLLLRAFSTIKSLRQRLKAAESELHERNIHLTNLMKLAHDRLQVALDTSKTGTFIWSQADDRLQWDKNLASLYGLHSSDSVTSASDFLKFVYGPDKQKVREHIERLLITGEDAVEFRIVVDGQIRWIRDFSKVTDRETMTVVGACTDETDLMRQIEDAHQSRQQALTASKVKTEFRNGATMLAYIEELLHVSRLDSSQDLLHSEKFDLKELIEERRNHHLRTIKAKDLTFESRIGRDTPDQYIGNKKIIAMVLDNLIANAISYSDSGKITLTADLKPRPGENGRSALAFRLTDEGQGIAPERQSRVFEAFTPRALSAGSTKSTGLGLYVARRPASMVGGTLLLDASRPGEGSTFSFTLPVTVCADTAGHNITGNATKAMRIAGPARKDLSGLSVLAVEDNASMQQLLKAILAQVNISPKVVDAAEHALELPGDEDFDVILMDVGLPGIDGIETARKLRERGYNGAIAAVSAHAFAMEKERARRSGCNEYFTKPIDKGALLGFLQKEHARLQ